MGADPDDVGAQEDEDVSTHLVREGRRVEFSFTDAVFLELFQDIFFHSEFILNSGEMHVLLAT